MCIGTASLNQISSETYMQVILLSWLHLSSPNFMRVGLKLKWTIAIIFRLELANLFSETGFYLVLLALNYFHYSILLQPSRLKSFASSNIFVENVPKIYIPRSQDPPCLIYLIDPSSSPSYSADKMDVHFFLSAVIFWYLNDVSPYNTILINSSLETAVTYAHNSHLLPSYANTA